MSNFSWQNLVLIAVGGGLGSVARYIAATLVHSAIPGFKPSGTLAVNLIGCLLIGLIMQIMNRSETVGTPAYFLLVTGILGGFTTFSAFGYETLTLWQGKQSGWMLVNIGGNLIGGLLAVFVGQRLADLCWRWN
jgi:CrcB protein